MTTKRWKQRVIELAGIYGPFVRFFPEGSEGDGGDGGDKGGGEKTSIVNPDGSFTKDWHKKYGDENSKTLSRFKKFDDLVNSHMSQRKKFGKNPDSLIEIPTETSSDEVRAAFHKARGVPDTEDGYKYEKSPDISAKVPVDDAQVKAFTAIAKKHNLTNKQLNGVMNDYLVSLGPGIDQAEIDNAEAIKQAALEGNAVLAKTFLGDADTRKARANAVFDKYGLVPIKMPDGSDATVKGMLLEQNPALLQSPYMIMLLDKIAESMSEDTLKGITRITVPTAAQVDSQITEVRTEMNKIQKENPVNFKNNPRYKELVERKHNLYKTKTSA